MNCNYLAFEGIDGSGKTTFIEEVSKAQKHMHNRRNRGKVLLDFSPKE